MQVAIKRALNPQGLNLKTLEEEVRNDPQITAVLIAAANSAALHSEVPVQTLLQALNKLGSTQSMNLILGLALKRSARLSDRCWRGTRRISGTFRCTPQSTPAAWRACSKSMKNAATARACCIAWAIWPCCVACRSGAWRAVSWTRTGATVAQ